MVKLRYLLFLFLPVTLMCVFWVSINPESDFAREKSIINEPIPSVALQIDIEGKILEGILLLKSSPPLVYETKNGKPSGNLIKKQIALAILNKTTGEVFEERAWVREDEIKNYKKTGVITLQPTVRGSTSNSWLVRVKWWNSFNTFYGIENGPDLIIVANKYLLESSYLSGLPEKSEEKYTDIIYVPYSRSLHLPEIIAAGGQYLENIVDRAFERLESDRIISHFSPNNSVITVVSKEFIKNIILIEHIDPDSFNLAGDGGQELTERVLAIVGANQERAYRYTGSPAGASGLAQFIKSTYQTIVSRYPEAHLLKDYNLGMADHINAVKAMVLFFDDYRKEIDGKITRQDVISQIGITEEMLAAAYNGGSARVVRSVNKYGLAWISGQLDLPRPKAILKNETLNYLEKFRSIKNLSIF